MTGRRVVIAAQRASRPSEFEFGSVERVEPEHCPFCAGNEAATPDPIEVYPDPGADEDEEWITRIVPNKFPALEIDADAEKTDDKPLEARDGFGAHEVVVESSEHRARFTDLTDEEARTAVRAWRDRVVDLERDDRLACAMPFKNEGAAAGTTIEHVHSQIVATPFVPDTLRSEVDGVRDHLDDRGSCPFCDLESIYRHGHARSVGGNDRVTVFAPFASRAPFELAVVPRGHTASIGDADDRDLTAVADALSEALVRLDRALGEPPLNLVVHTAPLAMEDDTDFHWHIEIIPAVSHVAGFEWGAGTFVNATAPEDAAAHLRDLA